MDSNLKLTINIDANLVDEAEEELFQILLKQHLSFNKRWYSSRFGFKIVSTLRFLGILLCCLGTIICIIPIVIPNYSCATVAQAEYYFYILLFVILGLLFYFLPSLESFNKGWAKTITIKNCRKISKRCIKKARELAPYQAEYDIKKDWIKYYRGKNDILELAWSRKLKGVAVYGKSATIFFKKWTSIQPIMVILHEDSCPLETVLRNQHIDFRSKDEQTSYL